MIIMLLGLFPPIFSVLSMVAADDRYISNGTCYYKSGAKADDNYGPVGNILYGHTFCCAYGHKINSRNACMDEPIGYVYLAGCTDPTYKHDSCPIKGDYADYQWVGMAQCANSTGWSGCPNDKSATPRKTYQSEGCTCDVDEDEILIEGVAGLEAVGHMPARKGGDISYEAGMKPTTFSSYPADLASSATSSGRTLATPATLASTTSGDSSTAVVAQTGAASASSLSTTASFTTSTSSSAAAIPARSNGLSHGAVGGISIGSCAAGIVLVAAVFIFWRLRKEKLIAQTEPSKNFESNSSTPYEKSTVPGFGEADSRPSTYAETKSELPGSPLTAPSQRESCFSQQSGPEPPSPPTNTLFYRPSRYQPANRMPNIQELPNHERPQWTRTGSGTFGPTQDDRTGEVHDGRISIHELPA